MNTKVMIHELEKDIKTLLCQLLDENGVWKELAKEMGYVDIKTAKYHSLLVSCGFVQHLLYEKVQVLIGDETMPIKI
jgi:hypothetical protein